MKEVKLQSSEVNNFMEFMKTSDSYCGNEFGSHDATINGYHIYLFEGKEDGGGIMHVYKHEEPTEEIE